MKTINRPEILGTITLLYIPNNECCALGHVWRELGATDEELAGFSEEMRLILKKHGSDRYDFLREKYTPEISMERCNQLYMDNDEAFSFEDRLTVLEKFCTDNGIEMT